MLKLILLEYSSGTNFFAISGTPGIGKSLFLIYIIYRLIKDKNLFKKKSGSTKVNQILYHFGKKFIIFDFIRKEISRISESNAENFLLKSDTFYIIDGSKTEPEIRPYLTFSLFITSPRSDYYKDYIKYTDA